MMSEAVVGIDLGTTNSSIAVLHDGVPEVITDHDDGLVPSCVGVGPSGNVLVGHKARNQAMLFPDRTVQSIKRRMGTADRIRLGSAEHSPQGISAFILKDLVARAERCLDADVSRAVITVPAYFTDAQRKATREAGELAGLKVERIVNEPTAASLAYEVSSKEAMKVLIYDLGGGTFDVSVVALEGGVVEVLATAGDNRLGGDDFDALIVERLNKRLESMVQGDSLRSDRTVQARLRHAAEAAKIRLSGAPFASIEEDSLTGASRKPVNLSCEISRSDFENDIKDLLDKTLEQVEKALRDANTKAPDLDRVLLVGGSSRIPLVAKLLQKRLGVTPLGQIDPDRCVALGAAIQAGMEAGLDVHSVLVDVTPYTFGTGAIGHVDGMYTRHKYVPIIRRNSKLPITKSELFYTEFPNQRAVRFRIYQGEDPDVRNNTEIGSVYLRGLNEDHDAFEEGLIFTYSLNLDGILEFHARERLTGREVSGRVEDALAAHDATFEEFDDLGELEPGNAVPTGTAVKMLLERAKAAIPNAPKEDVPELKRLMKGLKRASRHKESGKIDELSGELAELLFFVE